MSRWFSFACGFVLATSLFVSSLALFAQDDNPMATLRPLLVDIRQSIPIVADVTIPVDGETITATLPFTVDIALTVGIRGQNIYTVVSTEKPIQLAVTALPLVGEVIDMDGIEWKILSAKDEGQVIATVVRDLATDGKFIFVTLEVRNATGKPVAYIPPNLVDSEGRVYEYSNDASYAIKETDRCDFYAKINPSLKRQCTIIYDIPDQADGLQLELTNLAEQSYDIETQLIALDIQQP